MFEWMAITFRDIRGYWDEREPRPIAAIFSVLLLLLGVYLGVLAVTWSLWTLLMTLFLILFVPVFFNWVDIHWEWMHYFGVMFALPLGYILSSLALGGWNLYLLFA